MKPKLAALAVVLVAAAACSKEDHVVVEPVDVGISDKLAAAYQDEDTSIYQASVPVRLPIRHPNGGEGQGPATPPFPRAPFIVASDLQTEIRFTISNLDDQPHSIELLVDPWNEFVRYHPGVQTGNDNNVVPDLSGFDKFFVVPGKSRTSGVITPDDCIELATDLATAENIVAAPPAGYDVNGMLNHLFNLQNRSTVFDPLITPHIPKVIPGMIGFDLGLRVYEKANVAVEVVVDVTDSSSDRVIRASSIDDAALIDMPSAELTPPAPGNGG